MQPCGCLVGNGMDALEQARASYKGDNGFKLIGRSASSGSMTVFRPGHPEDQEASLPVADVKHRT